MHYPTPKLGLFDLDGTLIHHEHDFFYPVLCRLFTELGQKPPERDHFDKLLARHELFSIISEKERPAFEEEFWTRFDTIPFPEPREIDGSLETLERLVASGCKIAIVTARTHLPEEVEHALLHHTSLLSHVEVVSTLGEPHLLTRQSSPHLKKSQILDVCKRLGFAPEESLIAGDSPSDILSGRAAGVSLTVALRSGGVAEDLLTATEPDLLIDTIADMPLYFELKDLPLEASHS